MFNTKALKKNFLIFLFFLNTLFANAKVYTFEQLLQRALKNNYELKRNENNKLGLIEDIKYENLSFLPKINFAYDISNLNKGEDRNDSQYELRRDSLSINLRYNLYDYRSRFTRLEILSEELKLKQLENCYINKKASLRFLELYMEIYKAKYSLKTYQQLSYLYERSINLKKKLYKQGLISILDVVLDENKYLKLKTDISQLNIKLDYLIVVLFNTSNILLNKDDLLKPVYTNTRFNLSSFKQNSIALKIKNKKDLKIRKEIDYIRKKSFPTFDIYLNNTFYKNNYDINGDTKNERDYKVGFEVRWTLNSILDYKYKKSKKLLELKENSYIYKQQEDSLIRDFNNKNLNISNFDKYKQIKEKLIFLLEKEKESKQRLYNQGLESKHKVLEVEERLIMENYQLNLKKIDNEKDKKYLSIIALKNSSCILP